MTLTRIPPLPSLREILKIYRLRSRKQLSQNFLLQPRVLAKVVKCAGNIEGSSVLEIGPGPGGLTREIMKRGVKNLSLVEYDSKFLPGLEQLKDVGIYNGIKFNIYNQDILRFNMDCLFPDVAPADWHSDDCNVHIIGNLPFHVSTPLITQLLHDISERRSLWKYGRAKMTLMFQKEVAERLTANIWDRQRSRLSIVAQALCRVEYKHEIPGSAFLPPPEVNAGVVFFEPLKEPIISTPYPYLVKFVKGCFAMKNKHLVRGVETLIPPERTDLIIKLFKEASVMPTKTPTQISLLEFRDLCVVYHRICESNPGIFDYDYRSPANVKTWRKRKAIQNEILEGNTLQNTFQPLKKSYDWKSLAIDS